ncbi:MAG: VanW family protein [Clostridiales bacterium]|nr:VanW family protein [Clostridiales bacterium]
MYKKIDAPAPSKRPPASATNSNIKDYSAKASAPKSKPPSSARPSQSKPQAKPGPKLGTSDASKYAPRTSAHRPLPTAHSKKRKKKSWFKSNMNAILVLGLAVVVLIGAIILLVQSGTEPVITGDFVLANDMILPRGVSIAGVDVGELTVAETRDKITLQLEPKLRSIAITLQNEHIDAVLHADDLGAGYEIEDALTEAMVQNKRNASYDVALSIDDETLMDSVFALNGDIPGSAANASFEIVTAESGKSSFVYTEGHSGMALDHESIAEAVRAALAAGTFVTRLTPEVQISNPTVTGAMLREKTTLLASYTTEYQAKRTSKMTDDEWESHQGRAHNIAKALGLMQIIELEPGQIFSFNNTTGKRRAANDWALAPAIYRGDKRKEPGGGVCQVSTTMFNALLRANVEIVERRGHSIASDYVTRRYEDGLGFDATVDDGQIDFRFRNNTDSTLYLFCWSEENPAAQRRRLLHIEIYGQAFPPGVEYRIRNEILEHRIADKPEEKPNKNEYIGFEIVTRTARDYYKVKTFVDKYINGVFVETVRTETTVYPMFQEQRTIGTKPTPTPAPGPATPTPKPHEATPAPLIPEE